MHRNGGFKRLFHKKELTNPDNPQDRDRMSQTFQAWFPEQEITGDIKEVKGGASWKREIMRFFCLFVFNMVKVVLKYLCQHF